MFEIYKVNEIYTWKQFQVKTEKIIDWFRGQKAFCQTM